MATQSLQHPLAAHETVLSLSGGDVRVRVRGPLDGPTMLMVHGLTYPLDVFTPVADILNARGCRTVQYDLYGRGESTWSGTPLTAECLAEAGLAVLDACEISAPVSVASLSNGDLIANALVAMRPHHVSHLLWIAPSGEDPRTTTPVMRWAASLPVVRTLLGWYLRGAFVRRMRGHQSHLPASAPAISAQVYATAIRTVRHNPYLASAAVSFIRHTPDRDAIEAVLARIETAACPVLLMSFGQELDVADTNLQVFRRLTNLTETNIPDGGHMGLLEEPEKVARAMAEFLEL